MNVNRAFLSPPFSPSNLDLYLVRTCILNALKKQLPRFHGTFLDIGSGNMPYRALVSEPPSRVDTYIGLDLNSHIYHGRDVEWDGHIMPFADASMDCAMAIEVLEHCPDPGILLGEACRVLKPGGIVFFTVPFIWPLHDVPFDEYRYTPFALERFLREAGFEQVDLQALGGWDASLAQMVGLWARRRPMPRGMRAVLSRFLWPIVGVLAWSDRLPAKFEGNTMMTGIWGTAVKKVASE